MKVAVILSVYKNDAIRDFENAVFSILEQTLPCDVFIFRDGVVSEDMQHVINQFSVIDNVKCVESESNVGLAVGLNRLIDHVVKGNYEYVARMDSDDLSYNDRIETQVEFFEENKDIHVCGTYCREFGSAYALTVKCVPKQHDDLENYSITRCPFIHPTVMFRTKVFLDGNRYPTDTMLSEDMAFWFLLLVRGYKFANIGQVLLDFKINDQTLNRRRGFSKAWSEFTIRFKYMIKLKKVSFVNLLKVSLRLVFNMMPTFAIKYAYRMFR
ncbi:glycosyltransferase [Vibrio sp. 10N.237.312.C02]|uniref:glycosyltransferase n=1 Tax=Vibrio TaxID=662 RepID=UPI00352FE39E